MAASSRLGVLNAGRLNAFRLNYVPRANVFARMAIVGASIDNVAVRIRNGSMTIRDVLNDAPNSCTFTVDNDTPPRVGGRLRVYLAQTGLPSVGGVLPAFAPVFSGQIQRADRTYLGRHKENEWRCEAIDDTSRGDWLRPFGTFVGYPADIVAIHLIYYYTPGPLSSVIEKNLPPITISLDGSSRLNDALREICKLIGGYFYWEDGVCHLFVTPEPGLTPDPIDGGPLRYMLNDPPIEITSDDSQIRTRVYGKGHAEPTITPIDANESRVPVADAAYYTPNGGAALAGSQRLNYSGVVLGGTGALVGPGVTPSAPPVLAAVGGSGVTGGAHTYALTWVTAAGETLPSPLTSITVNPNAPTPVIDKGETNSQGNTNVSDPPGTVVHYRIYIAEKFYNGSSNYPDAGLVSNYSPEIIVVSGGNYSGLYFTVTPDMRGRFIGIVANNGGGWRLTSPSWGYTGWGVPFADNEPLIQQRWGITANYYNGVPLPTAGTMVMARVQVSGIAVGPSGTIARKLYRTQAGSSALQLLATIADNSTTTYLDASADAALGAAPPAIDTSGLKMTEGQVPVGATALPVSSTAWALPTGGWAIVGNGDVVVKYAGVSGNQLVGIPASGNGSIVAPVNFNSTITGAPMLTGVTWTPPQGFDPVAVPQGTDVAIWVQRDDVDAQTALAARWGTGIIEHLISDGRRGERSLTALCDADLAMYSRPLITARYTTLDQKTRSGRPVRITLPLLGIDQTLTIQDVTIDNFGGKHPPRFHVTAGSLTMTLEDMLRRMAGSVLAEEF